MHSGKHNNSFTEKYTTIMKVSQLGCKKKTGTSVQTSIRNGHLPKPKYHRRKIIFFTH